MENGDTTSRRCSEWKHVIQQREVSTNGEFCDAAKRNNRTIRRAIIEVEVTANGQR